MKMPPWSWDLIDALRYGSAMPYRWMLAVSATVYAILTALGPSLEDASPVIVQTSLVLSSGWKWGWALVFATDALCMWWRIFDRAPKLIWAWGINIATTSLWGGVTVATITATGSIAPGVTGYIVLTLMAFVVLCRTEATARDRVTA